MRNRRILLMTTHAMLTAILLMMGFFPQIGFITINPAISFTLVHVPVLIGAYLFGWRGGAVYGFLFGIVSLWQSWANPTGILDPFFQNPLISVLPRVLFGLFSGLTFDAAIRLVRRSMTNAITLSIAAGTLTIIHTLLTLGMMGLVSGNEVLNTLGDIGAYFDTFSAFIGAVLVLNGIWEALIAVVVIPLLALALSKLPSIKNIIMWNRGIQS